ncbi:MAG TPA: tRNA (adenosine(37)-N6)-threonylcarbamoyltransferase complex dimerization subunit type 1 TsaB [Rickettsiales bacterium]|nr:tRNA (adenosine(37)-N6)-threonylcarbamoyltransferase complex dimerization subunit type 1 TsaB [Rickettsiales bacterium]
MTAPLQILAIDTSLGTCSVALWQGDKVTHSQQEEKTGTQSRRLIPMIEELLKAGNTFYQELDALACTIGPGGFTGIRVGLTTARALRLATGKPLIGLTTLEVMAHASDMQGDMLSIIDAYRGQFYVQRFRRTDSLRPLSDALLVEEKMISALAHGAKKITTPPDAAGLASLATAKWLAGERTFPDAPLYIREPDAKLPAAK